MNRSVTLSVFTIVVFLLLIFSAFRKAETDRNSKTIAQQSDSHSQKEFSEDLPNGAIILMKAYPDHVKGYKDGRLIMKNGVSFIYDDGRKKGFVEKMDNPDIEDMFSFKYDQTANQPAFMQDAGRCRHAAFFKSMYGHNAAEVRSHLIAVPWFGEKVMFTKINGAADSLKAVANELKRHPELKRYLKSSGTFNWREVRGSKRISAHSFGMTIDIGVQYADYWLWKNLGKKETDAIKYVNRFPMELVRIFENHGFIWGGRWYHYDTMHFEFRPELLMNVNL